MLYFGYGSNLFRPDLDRYCRDRGLPPIRLFRIGPGFLPDRRLAFTHRSSTRGGGVLDVPPARGEAVAGVLFRVDSDASIAALDRKEGEGHDYLRFEAVVLTEDGGERSAVAYQVAPACREPFVAPSPTYLDVVRQGYSDHGLELSPLEAAASGRSPAGPVPGVFVYGSLRRGEERHPVMLRHVSTRGESATTTGTLVDLDAHPGLVVEDPLGSVTGELYEAQDPAELLEELDEIEDFRGFGVPGSLYRRAIVRVQSAESGSKLAWTYIFSHPPAGARIIESGDWRGRRRP